MEISNFLTHGEKDTANVRQVKNLYRALREKDSEQIAKLLVDVPTWNVSPGFPGGDVYKGLEAVFGTFYKNVRSRFDSFAAAPEVFIDGEDVVTVLGFYKFKLKGIEEKVRFSHTWKIDSDGRINGVWQVADTAMFLK